ncbi:MAG: GlsB/YeaQ/YmgE family stress response membrane protein [Armatimonadota bacterium]
MNIIGWIILGAVAGWLASLVMGTNRRQGCFMDIVIGIVGALIGGLLFNLLGGRGVTGFNLWSLFVAFLGAVILLFIVGLFRRRTRPGY